MLLIFSVFSPMKDGGGLQFLISKAGKRSELVSVAIGAIPVSRLKHITHGRIYVRPLQQDLKMEPCEGLNCTFIYYGVKTAFWCYDYDSSYDVKS